MIRLTAKLKDILEDNNRYKEDQVIVIIKIFNTERQNDSEYINKNKIKLLPVEEVEKTMALYVALLR